jgi:hypothetical protein
MPLTKIQSLGITDGTIVNADINASAAIAGTKLSGAGKVLQVVNATDSTSRTTTSATPVTASNTLTVTLTPSSASNKVFVIANFNLHQSSNETYSIATIYRGATNIGNSNGGMGRIWSKVSSLPIFPMTISVLDSPNTTSATTYQVYIWLSGSGTTYFNGLDNNAQASITAFEIAG